jgi:protein-tyrosine-phosphatase
MPSIIILCTANMVRSPIAEALLRRKLSQKYDQENWIVESAGTWTIAGRPAIAKTREVMQRLYGIDLSTHRTRLVSRSLLRPYDLILVMEAGQKEALQTEFPEFGSRVYLLYEMIGQVHNVGDPIAGTKEDFEDTAHEIDDLLTRGLDRIVELGRGEKLGEDGFI